MSNETHVSQPLYGLLHSDVEGFDSLAELALDMRSPRVISHRDGIVIPL